MRSSEASATRRRPGARQQLSDRSYRRVGVIAGLTAALAIAAPARALERIHPDVAWAQRVPAPRAALGLDHPPTPGVLLVEMSGVELKPYCGSGQLANAALDCTPLVRDVTDIPAWGSATEQAALLQQLRNLYDPFDLIITATRPPEWMPYTMAVVGGTSDLVTDGGGVCGLANVACDGAKRNHVSLTFPESCPNAVVGIAAQETAHNWGLEHVDDKTDVMYPYTATANPTFHDECITISNATGSPITSCPQVHRLYCPEGDGEQQNAHEELLGVFGPRAEDTTPPVIVATTPGLGDVWTTADAFTVSATIDEDSTYVAVRWTWTDGLPAELGTSYSRCTNGVCDEDYGAWITDDEPFAFVNLVNPPAGEYTMTVEALDARGHYAGKEIRFTVIDSDVPSNTGTPGEDTGALESGPGWTTDASAGDTDSGGGDGDGDDTGCGCWAAERAPGPASLAWLLLALVRRRARAV